MGGQPDRFYVTADSLLSVREHFTGFGADMTALRKRLRVMSGARLHDGFPEYGKDFRRRLGIESEQAMELFHQTVSMKSVGNLTDFVREHMLEPFHAAKAVADIVAHFEDLTKAHEAVQRAQAQLALLAPLLKEADAYDAVDDEIATLTARQEALPYYFADLKADLLERHLAHLGAQRTRLRPPSGTSDQLLQAPGTGDRPEGRASGPRRQPARRHRAADRRAEQAREARAVRGRPVRGTARRQAGLEPVRDGGALRGPSRADRGGRASSPGRP